MDLDSDLDLDSDWGPAIFVIDLQDAKKNLFKKEDVCCLLIFEGTFTSFFIDKKSKRRKQ
jgi:hypothetical protein